MIVLDTDAVSNLMRPRPSPEFAQRIERLPVSERTTTAITIGELAYGAARAGRPQLYFRAKEVLEGTRILSFDEAAAELYANIRAHLERAGTRLDEPDLRIAATVLAHGATLITGNVRHFQRVPGLAVENWLEASA